MSTRKAHHKSRFGCATCKAKKVKCDEKRPCGYCAKRHLSCSLAATSLPLPSPETIERSWRTPEARFTTPSYEAPSFTSTDFSLFRHFTKSTALAQADDSASEIVWREAVLDLATQYPYLLHEVLAIAALHLRTTASEQSAFLERTAAEHQAKAIPLFREALVANSTETALPLFACSCLFVPYHFAAVKNPSSLLFNEETGSLAEWLVLIQGCAAVTVEHNATIMQSPLRALLGDLYTPRVENLSGGSTDARLVELGRQLPVIPERREVYEQVMIRLRVCYYLSDNANTPLNRKNAALRFPPIMGHSFTEDLALKSPAALIVMAYWCVLLHRVEDRWWLKGRVKPLLLKIAELVPFEYAQLMAWPKERVASE
ncbi:hypothetical protein F4821DRAFT_48973 [Hypoxylon rubiginosum]|uniref:Uncharacterized protein n=1 Tax=Hypoxylon rubiginosum TaxID=110542 RepID=A0ACC0CK23_9PEZI|nr:hypothetical protein F4821DRAFT_48973 [Hypoxylon rubiginosum]